MKLEDLDLNKTYSYADYLTWQFDEMVELIKGKIFCMSPAPNTSHQEISHNLDREFGVYLKNKKCKVFHAPFDVRLPKKQEQGNEQIYTVVQPDITVICDLSKIDQRGCLGAPDLVIEILSKSTAKKDTYDKFQLYEESGVKEYWIVHPNDQTILTYFLNDEGKYVPSRLYTPSDKLKVGIFDDLILDLEEIFDTL